MTPGIEHSVGDKEDKLLATPYKAPFGMLDAVNMCCVLPLLRRNAFLVSMHLYHHQPQVKEKHLLFLDMHPCFQRL